MSRSFRFIHSFGIEFIILKTELLENRLIVWNIEDSKKLFSQGYYGKPIGIPKPKLDEINVPLILDLIEGYYLMNKSKIQIYKNKKKITLKKMFEICQEQHHNFDKMFQVYKDFRDKGYIVNPGIKFGCDFAVYQKGPGIDHAPFFIHPATLVPDELEYAEGYKDVMTGLKEKMIPMDSKSDTSERKENYEDPD